MAIDPFTLEQQKSCYPPAFSSPFWYILVGFSTSIIFTAIAFFSTASIGTRIFNQLKKLYECCCKWKKKESLYLHKSNHFRNFPTILYLKSSTKDNYLSGYYYRKDVNDSNDIPEYHNDRQNFDYQNHVNHPGVTHLYMHYVPEQSKWIISLKNLSHDFSLAKQIIISEYNVNAGNIISTVVNDDKDCYISVVDNDAIKALELLNQKTQNWMVYSVQPIPMIVNDLMSAAKISHTDFNCINNDELEDIKDEKKYEEKIDTDLEFKSFSKYRNNDHYFELKGFDIIQHNVLEYDLFNLNGKYILS
eukprot:126595_1